MSRTSAEIVQIIRDNKLAIFNKLYKESIEVYIFLMKTFQETQDVTNNGVFKFLFRSFYRLDNAGLSPEFKEEYFQILQELRDQIECSNDTIISISNRLDQFIRLNNTKSFQFSFISKMLNTIDVNSPIWDSEVRLVFKFSTIQPKLPLNEKIKMAIGQLTYMKDVYKEIEDSNELNIIIQEFDKKYGAKAMSFNKKLDFILWSAGKILKK